MLAVNDSTKTVWETLQIIHVSVKRVKEAKVQTLKSEFESIHMKDGESIDDFAMKLTTIVSDIRSLSYSWRRSLSSISFFKLFPWDSCRLLLPSSNSRTSRTCRLRRPLVVLRSMIRDFVAMTIERWSNIAYSHMRSGLHGQKGKMWLILPFSGMKVHGGHNKKSRGCGRGRGHDNGRSGKEGRDNTSQIHNNVNSWKDKSMIKCYACEKYWHYAVECCNKERDEETNLTFMDDEEPTF